jgi:diguanylate cyclase (GGDEF)-like protein
MRGPLACLVQAGLLLLALPAQLPQLLDEAERVRKSDKPHARQILDEVNRALAAKPDPLLIARAQLLECQWADTPDPAYRAVAVGLDAAAKAHNDRLRAKLLQCRGAAYQFGSRNGEAERDYLEAARFAAASGDAATAGEALASAGDVQYERGAMAEALTNLQAAYRSAETRGDEKARLDALTVIANVYADAHVAQYDKAVEYYQQLLTAYERRGEQYDVADTLFNLGATSETKGDLAVAEGYYRRALQSFERQKKPSDVAFCQRALGSCLIKRGQPDAAMPLLNAAVAYYESAHDASQSAASRQYRGIAERRLGRATEALADLQAARTFYEREKNGRFLERNLEETALAYAARNEWRQAFDAQARHGALQAQQAEKRRDELSSRLRVEFDTAKKEQENRALVRENGLRAAALTAADRERSWQRAAIALTALLAAALAVLFWRQVVNTRRMRAMAMTDELTRLPNRRNILAVAESAFWDSQRLHRALSVIAFDIDHFKRINDTWGHAAGDEVLKNVARTCRMVLRPSDHVGRTGGEEFLVVLRDTTASQAVEVAERLRAAVEELDFSAIEPGLRITISLGVQAREEQRSIDTLIKGTDELLYRAKAGGRNRVASAA